MALSNAIDEKTGVASATPKIVPHPAENCISPNNCQYWVANKGRCSLGECPFRRPREFVGLALTEAQDDDINQEITQTERSCCICGGAFVGFIGAVPICSTCMSRLKYVIATPHCPGCGAVVGTPHQICSSCKARFEDIGAE